jgi:hypothetical protein
MKALRRLRASLSRLPSELRASKASRRYINCKRSLAMRGMTTKKKGKRDSSPADRKVGRDLVFTAVALRAGARPTAGSE